MQTLRAMRRPAAKQARFVLRYAPVEESPITVGELDYDGSMWTFTYADEYKSREGLRPIEGFDDVERVYRSSALFPFFAVRIPDIHRPDVVRKLEKARVKNPEPTDLLRLFGRQVVSSPAFELLPA